MSLIVTQTSGTRDCEAFSCSKKCSLWHRLRPAQLSASLSIRLGDLRNGSDLIDGSGSINCPIDYDSAHFTLREM